MSEWQPIETAKDDARLVLVWVPAIGRVMPCRCHPWGLGNGDPDVKGQPGVWEGLGTAQQPTHWQPLPPPPAAEEQP